MTDVIFYNLFTHKENILTLSYGVELYFHAKQGIRHAVCCDGSNFKKVSSGVQEIISEKNLTSMTCHIYIKKHKRIECTIFDSLR